MRKSITTVVLVLLPFVALAQNKILSSAPNSDSLPVKQLETNIDFLMRELDILHKKIVAMYPMYADIAACGALGRVYAPGAAGVGTKCVSLGGPPFVSEIKATSATDDGNMSGYGSTPSTRLQGFINSNGCLTSEGWHVCTDDEVIFALDNRVTGATTPTTIINGSEYWIRSLVPYRSRPSENVANGLSSYTCDGWTGTSGKGTAFSGVQNRPEFTTAKCEEFRRALCCR